MPLFRPHGCTPKQTYIFSSSSALAPTPVRFHPILHSSQPPSDSRTRNPSSDHTHVLRILVMLPRTPPQHRTQTPKTLEDHSQTSHSHRSHSNTWNRSSALPRLHDGEWGGPCSDSFFRTNWMRWEREPIGQAQNKHFSSCNTTNLSCPCAGI